VPEIQEESIIAAGGLCSTPDHTQNTSQSDCHFLRRLLVVKIWVGLLLFKSIFITHFKLIFRGQKVFQIRLKIRMEHASHYFSLF